VCLGLSLLSNSLWLSRMTSSYLSCNNLCCNSLLAWITKQFNSPDFAFVRMDKPIPRNFWILVDSCITPCVKYIYGYLGRQKHNTLHLSCKNYFVHGCDYLIILNALFRRQHLVQKNLKTNNLNIKIVYMSNRVLLCHWCVCYIVSVIWLLLILPTY
jgi:hypothetical protein